MYVCLCKNVTDHRIRGAVEDGARSWREVQQVTGCGTQCGKCAGIGKDITREAIRDELRASAEGLAYAV
ncbi:(2Fe-2S)-binding protein [Halomonas lysinitropha]|uniref:Bacterioferritin-associated ferredoxin n=1 Tax=Halomonas lysinitropha TaxID=2607506 RepID=A0A5K1I709_9GAMM|nr:(2Fe-2S)-binding protein [Halomonas lysinitropha]VVZ94892.1 Bacterioferritin-associated ferredoxin [Halomonas lysinitropha]